MRKRIFRMELIPFCYREFDPDFGGVSKEEFTQKVNKEFEENNELKDGYAPFCKHYFVSNFTNARTISVPITEETEPLIKTGYESRTEKELAVLKRWIPKESFQAPTAKYLDVILYSRDQIKKECEEMGDEFTLSDGVEWGIVSIKPQNENCETPMDPITVLRNALGKSEGGSGVPLDREKYNESVAFWSTHVLVK